MQQQKSNVNLMIWNLTTEFPPYLVTFKVINVLFPSISRAHGKPRESPSRTSFQFVTETLFKTPEEAALGYLGDGEHDVSGCYQGGISSTSL